MLRRNLIVACILSCASLSTAGGAQLRIHPDKLDLTGRDPLHGLLVTLVADDGKVTDVARRASFKTEGAQTATVDDKGVVTALADGQTALTIQVDNLTAKIPVSVTALAERSAPSFKQDILPILTKTGCNMGGCHGKLAGQNGFRLSLRGFAPEWDYDWLTREVNARRVDFAFPEESLLLRKPSGGLPHEGGTRFRADSRAWKTLRDWVAARAPAPISDEKDAASLEVLPGDRLIAPGETQQLLVRARYADGRVRDVTWLAQFFSNDETTIAVKPAGLVKPLRCGEGGVRVHFQGLVQVVRFTMPFPHTVPSEVYAARQNALDEPVFKKLQQLHLPPAGPCSDAQFLRRAFLDATGTLPAPEEVLAFRDDKRPDKRAQLVESLLNRPEFTDYWTLQLADLLQNRKERDHDVRGQKGVRAFHAWLRSQVAANRPWNDIARDVLLAKGDVIKQPQAGYFVTVVGERNNVEDSELPDSVAQSFLGTRIGCARCHNHPLERYTQDDFYHFAACFSKVFLDRRAPETGATVLTNTSRDEREQQKRIADAAQKLAEACKADLPDDEKSKKIAERQRELDEQNKRLKEIRERAPGVNQPRTGKFMAPQPLDRQEFKVDPGGDPRQPFVNWMLTSESFSGAMVNRLWKHFFATGLVEPVDDLRASNPPSNAALWKILNDEFRAHKFDLKYIIRLILNSRAYQLDSATVPENETDNRFYSHYIVRRLPAEVMLDAIAGATGVPNPFPGYPVGLRATQLADAGADSYFLTLFGRSDRVTACACERKGEVTLPQLLHLKNSEDLQRQINDGTGRLSALLKNPDNSAVMDSLFLSTLNRVPTEAERAAVNQSLTTDKREGVFADLFWALLNAEEFAFNH
ncbi:MAG TPA: DUF1549 domain-containing protein [Verrucomicrobiales bacterium]|nr:DUF1549 domain-containing protein [Verrucomicrobiales bacterium]